TRRTMIQDVIRTLFRNQFPSFFSAAGADDGKARGMSDLHGRRSDPAARSMHEHGFAGPCMRPMKERPIRRSERYRDARSLLKRNPLRQGPDLRLAAQRFLRVGPTQRAGRVNAI